MRIVLLCGDQSNQHALASKVSKDFNLVGIALEAKRSNHRLEFSFLLSKITDRLFFYKINSSWKAMLNYYKEKFPPAKTVTAVFENINSEEAIDFIKKLKPDLIMVSGTRLIKNKLLELEVQKGIINLHTGLSPYIKGGPNCTNWCIANNTIHLIGNTIMWIDKGIDSGNIITTDTVNFTGNETLNDIHIKVMEHAHELYIKALHSIKNSYSDCPSVKQSDIAKGRLFMNKEWNFNAKLRFVFNLMSNNFQKSISATDYITKQKELTLITLP